MKEPGALFQELYKRYLPSLDEAMRETVASFDGASEEFRNMIAYPMGWVDADGHAYSLPTGKRIRPIILLACIEAAGGDWNKGIYAAAAVEILHNFSLVHDDIQDNSDVRHGRDTVWRVWGEPMAINAGDAMFALSYRAVEFLSKTNLPAQDILNVLKIYNRTILELTRGQYLDMHFENRHDVSVAEYLSMVRGKTAALLAGAAEIGALIAGQPPSIAEKYATFGLNIGIAFQIRDDILGIWGDAEKIGKSTSTDIIARKKSVPILYGLEHSQPLQNLYAQPEPLKKHEVKQAIQWLEQVGAYEYALQQETQYYDRSIDALKSANPTDTGHTLLLGIVDTLFQRSH